MHFLLLILRMFLQMFRGTSAVDTFCAYSHSHFWQQEMRMLGYSCDMVKTSCQLSKFCVQKCSGMLWYDSGIQLILTGKQ